MIIIKKFIEKLEVEDQKEILDLQSDLNDLKKRKLDSEDSEEKEKLSQDMEDIKNQIDNVKSRDPEAKTT